MRTHGDPDMRSICELRRNPRMRSPGVAYAKHMRAMKKPPGCARGFHRSSHMRRICVCAPRGSARAALESHMRSICELRRFPPGCARGFFVARICVTYACVPFEGPRAALESHMRSICVCAPPGSTRASLESHMRRICGFGWVQAHSLASHMRSICDVGARLRGSAP